MVLSKAAKDDGSRAQSFEKNSMMSLDQDGQNATQQATWKNRLQTWQNSLRKSIRPKQRQRSPKKSNWYVKVPEEENLECQTSKRTNVEELAKNKDSPSRLRNDNKSHFWRERKTERKQAIPSNADSQHDKIETKSTTNGHSMNEKTFTDRKGLDSGKPESRKHGYDNIISEAKKSSPQGGDRRNARHDENSGQSSSNNTQEQHKNNKTTSLWRPKSLSVLTSLFKRSSSSTRTQNINTNRGNQTGNRGTRKSENSLSSLGATEDKFVLKCDPGVNFSSSESFTDTEFSPRLAGKYYSLKRSRASLIYPRSSPTCDRRTRREKARTLCCEHEFLQLAERSTEYIYSSEFDMDWNGGKEDAVRVSSRSVCFLTRERRAFSDLSPTSVSTLGLRNEMDMERGVLQPLNISTDRRSTYYGHKNSSDSSICSTALPVSSREASFSSIPIVGVTLVDNEGNEKNIDPLENGEIPNATGGFESLTVKGIMGNLSTSVISAKLRGSAEKKTALKHAKSNPEIYNKDRRCCCTLNNLSKKRGSQSTQMFTPVRHSSTALKENQDMSSRRSSVEQEENDSCANSRRRRSNNSDKCSVRVGEDDFDARSLTLTSKNRSLNRSADCLSMLSDSKTNKLRKLDGESNGMGGNGNGMQGTGGTGTGGIVMDENKCGEDQPSDYKEFCGAELNNNTQTDSSLMGLQCHGEHFSYSRTFEDESQSCSLPSTFDTSGFSQNRSITNDDGSKVETYPNYCSTPVEKKPSLFERRRALSNENSPKFYNYNRTCNQDGVARKPPYVKPRIQSLEELSPMAVDAIMRKKISLLKKTRFRHSISVPSAENFGESIGGVNKRYSYQEDRTDFNASFLSCRSQSAEILTSQESLVSNSSLSVSEYGSATSIGSEKYLTPPPTQLARSRSIAIPLDSEQDYGNPVVGPGSRGSKSPGEVTRKRLYRNLRLGKSTGDLNFEPSGTLEPKQIETEDYFEDMEMPEAFAEALWDHVTMDPEELSFRAGDAITVISMTNVDWWFGQVGDQVGWFPAPFVRVRVSQTLGDEENRLTIPVRSRRGTNEGLLTNDDVRARVVKEILNTEKDYVKNLRDVVEGYLRQAQKRVEMFTDDQINMLFSNIEEIYKFHQDLHAKLKECYVKDDPCDSMIGQVFLENKQGFSIYSEYCNNHPQAIAELKTLCESNNYKHFFEACRLLQDMINISLDGFLLTPVQKICKYPLQLAELLKHTYPSHKDYEPVRQALATMKEVASSINERKRKVENIYKIAKWQSTIEGWEGENVLERSSELIHSGDVHKISVGTSQERVFFLFDNQLVYCKKDILRKNGLSYKGRIDMNTAHVTWLEDREEYYKNEPLLNAWKIYNETKSKWYVAYTKTKEQKDRWKKAFTEERRIVNQDAVSGMTISRTTRRAAMRAANSSIKGKKERERTTERRERFVRSASEFIKPSPPSPTLRLPPPVSCTDFIREETENSKTDKDSQGFLQRTSVLRRSFGLRGSGRKKQHSKEKRMSSVF